MRAGRRPREGDPRSASTRSSTDTRRWPRGCRVGIEATARPGSGRLRVPAWDLEATAGDDSAVGRALAAIVRRLEAPALDFDAEAAIPSRAGLGSSAAMAVAIARAAAAASGRAPDDSRD